MRLSWVRWLSTGAADERDATFFSPLPLFWRVLGALLLGVLMAKWSWVLFAPHATATAPVSEQGISPETARLFGVAVSAAMPVEVAALPNVQLVGVFAAGSGKTSFAVLSQDGKQIGVTIGENVFPGTKLTEVHADYVLLERAGVQHRVNLAGTASDTAAMAPVQR